MEYLVQNLGCSAEDSVCLVEDMGHFVENLGHLVKDLGCSAEDTGLWVSESATFPAPNTRVLAEPSTSYSNSWGGR